MYFDTKSKPDEIEASKEWVMANFGTELPVLPFSFKYGDHSSGDLLKTWKAEQFSEELDEFRTQRTLTYTDPKGPAL